jgi:hypothetical protein
MAIKDTFPYGARWDSVGLDCSFCIHERNADWPNAARNYACGLHHLSLVVQLGKNGYKKGEWFCTDFHDGGRAFPEALRHFQEVRDKLQPLVLYGFYGAHGNLQERPFAGLPKVVP